MKLLREMFSRIRRDKRLARIFKEYMLIYSEDEDYPEEHWWWNAL